MSAPNEMSKWDFLARPPATALKTIKGGRLNGMSDVNPQWRYKAMHDVYGPCGIGWKYAIDKIWTEQGMKGQVFMFVQISVWVKEGGEWSDAIPGIGGSMLLAEQSNGMHHNDEAVKMATTDALSVALKMLGVAADIYMGRWDGSKYKDEEPKVKATKITPMGAVIAEDPEIQALLDDPEESAFLKNLAMELVEMVEKEKSPIDAYKHLCSMNLGNTEKLALNKILEPNSKTRSALKEQRNIAVKLEKASELAGAM